MAKEIKFRTRGELDIVNLTLGVERLVNVRNGICKVSVHGGDSALVINENESGLLEDFRNIAKRLSAEGMSLSQSVVIPVSNSALRLGTWQRILFVELGKKPQQRSVTVEFAESGA